MNAVIFMAVSMAALVLILKINRVPRRSAFDIAIAVVWVYVFSFNVALSLLDKTKPDLMHGLVPYFAAVMPSAFFSIYLIKRAKPTRKTVPLSYLQ